MTLHNLLMIMSALAVGFLELDIVPPGSLAAKLIMLALVGLNAAGVQVAAKWQPPSKLQPMPPPPSGASLRVLLPLALLTLAGCGTAYQASYATLATLERQVITAAEELPRADAAKQDAIVNAAKSHEEGAAALKAWRAKRADGEKAITGTHASIRLARDGVLDLEKGAAKGDPRQLVIMATRAVGNLAALLDAVGFDWKSLVRSAIGGL
jgi:hypothetical protein